MFCKPVKKKTTSDVAIESRRACREIYEQEIQKRYGIPAMRNARTNSIIMQLVNEIGVLETPNLVQFFMDSNDEYYVRRFHDLTILKTNLHEIRAKYLQVQAGIREKRTLKETLAGMHHGFDKKDYRAGVDEHGRLIDEPYKPSKDYNSGVDEHGRLIH